MVIDVALLDIVEETELLERFLPEADDVVLGLAGGGGQQVGDGLEDGADGLYGVAKDMILLANMILLMCLLCLF